MKNTYNYVYGSAAPKYTEQPYQQERKSNEVKVKRKVKNTPTPKAVAQPEAGTFPMTQMIICILITFAVFSTIIYRYSTITEMNYALSALNKEYESLKDSNRKLQVSIGSKINQENIRKIAEERLNMKMPDSYQRVPVKVSKVNYSTINIDAQEEKGGTLKALLMFFGIE